MADLCPLKLITIVSVLESQIRILPSSYLLPRQPSPPKIRPIGPIPDCKYVLICLAFCNHCNLGFAVMSSPSAEEISLF
jgi:hypothetical protein